jgi:opacity protein-like surface antigen
MTLRPGPLLSALAAAALLTPRASAFEKQWHLGGGAGVNAFADGESVAGPALAVYGAYGLSDLFDFGIQVLGSRHVRDHQSFDLLGISTGISYKLDVMSWIPYAGLELGYYRFLGDTRPRALSENEAGFSLDLGLDYLLSQSVGLGLEFRYHGFLHDFPTSLAEAPLFTGLIRAEYHWGF